LRAYALFKLGVGEDVIEVAPGEFIGRSDLATVCVDDPRVSEAHAMVSLRGHSLKLLALRGRFMVDGKVSSEVSLGQGVEIELARGLKLQCLGVSLPSALPGVEIDGMPPFLLTGTMTFYLETPIRVTNGFDPRGDMIFWAVGNRWRASIGREPAREVAIGDRIEHNGVTLQITSHPIQNASQTATKMSLRLPMTLYNLRSAVRIEREGEPPLLVSGIPGKIFAALLGNEQTMDWRSIAACVWPGDVSLQSALRRRFDAGLARLREKLDSLTTDGEELVRLDGAGMLTLALTAQDRIVEKEDGQL
jgi:hypothetical protein